MKNCKQRTDVVVFHSHGVGQNIRLRALPQEGETLRAESWEIGTDGGKGSNAALALARLGLSVELIAKVGDDLWADLCLDTLCASGMGLGGLIRDPAMSTQIGAVMVDDLGRNSIVLGGSTASFTDAEIHRLLGAAAPFRFFVTGFEIEPDSALRAAQHAKQQGAFTVLNPSPVPQAGLAPTPYIDLLVLNEAEAHALLEHRGEHLSAREVLAALRQQYEICSAVITRGALGCVGLSDSGYFELPGIPVRAVDTSGAGDAFLAAAVAALCLGHDLRSACEWATLYAAQAVRLRGTFPAYETLEAMKRKFPEQTHQFLFPKASR